MAFEHTYISDLEYKELLPKLKEMVEVYKKETGIKRDIDVFAKSWEQKNKKKLNLADYESGKWRRASADQALYQIGYIRSAQKFIESELGNIYAKDSSRVEFKQYLRQAFESELDI